MGNDRSSAKRDISSLKFVIHGRGKLGGTLVNALTRSGVDVVQDPTEADLVWFCLPEHVLVQEVERVALAINKPIIFVHSSGFLVSSVLRIRDNIRVASLHPAYSFSEVLEVIPESILWCFEGDADVKQMLMQLVKKWCGRFFEIDPACKPAYHTACVFLSNLLSVPAAAAEKICKQHKLPFDSMARSLIPSLCERLSDGEVLTHLTGPAARGDRTTVEAQQAMLSDHFPREAKIYRALSDYVIQALKSDCVSKKKTENSE